MSNAKLNNRQRRPTHPGELLREEILPAANITQGELAKRMGVPRRRLNEICQESHGVGADMAHRLARVLNTTPDVWMNLQATVDLWEALDALVRIIRRSNPWRWREDSITAYALNSVSTNSSALFSVSENECEY